MNVLPAFMSALCVWCSQRPEQNIRSLWNWSFIQLRATSGCWDLYLGPREEQLGFPKLPGCLPSRTVLDLTLCCKCTHKRWERSVVST